MTPTKFTEEDFKDFDMTNPFDQIKKAYFTTDEWWGYKAKYKKTDSQGVSNGD